MTGNSQSGAYIFISYAHEDEDLKKELDKYLKVLKRSGKVQVWQDRELIGGQEWDQTIMSELNKANIILLLSRSFELLCKFHHFNQLMKCAKDKIAPTP